MEDVQSVPLAGTSFWVHGICAPDVQRATAIMTESFPSETCVRPLLPVKVGGVPVGIGVVSP